MRRRSARVVASIQAVRGVLQPLCMPITTSFRQLKVWQKSMTLVEDLYAMSKGFPADERYGLTSQLRRAAVSIPSNIGEGCRRKRRKSQLYHLEVALGSQGEVDVQAELAHRLGFCGMREYRLIAARIDEIGRMLNGLIESLQPFEEEV